MNHKLFIIRTSFFSNFCKQLMHDINLPSQVGAVLGLFVVSGAAAIGIILYPAAFHIPPIFWVIGFILPLIGKLQAKVLCHLPNI